MVEKETKQKTQARYVEMYVLPLCFHDINSFRAGDWNNHLIWVIKVPSVASSLCTKYNEGNPTSKIQRSVFSNAPP